MTITPLESAYSLYAYARNTQRSTPHFKPEQLIFCLDALTHDPKEPKNLFEFYQDIQGFPEVDGKVNLIDPNNVRLHVKLSDNAIDFTGFNECYGAGIAERVMQMYQAVRGYYRTGPAPLFKLSAIDAVYALFAYNYVAFMRAEGRHVGGNIPLEPENIIELIRELRHDPLFIFPKTLGQLFEFVGDGKLGSAFGIHHYIPDLRITVIRHEFIFTKGFDDKHGYLKASQILNAYAKSDKVDRIDTTLSGCFRAPREQREIFFVHHLIKLRDLFNPRMVKRTPETISELLFDMKQLPNAPAVNPEVIDLEMANYPWSEFSQFLSPEFLQDTPLRTFFRYADGFTCEKILKHPENVGFQTAYLNNPPQVKLEQRYYPEGRLSQDNALKALYGYAYRVNFENKFHGSRTPDDPEDIKPIEIHADRQVKEYFQQALGEEKGETQFYGRVNRLDLNITILPDGSIDLAEFDKIYGTKVGIRVLRAYENHLRSRKEQAQKLMKANSPAQRQGQS